MTGRKSRGWSRHIALVMLLSLLAFVVTIAPANKVYANQLPYYNLPWAAGTAHTVTQGNGGSYSHQVGTYGQYAWDFGGDGWTIYSSRSGAIAGLKDSYGTGGCDSSYANMANYVVVRSTEADGTNHDALYLHVAQASASARVSLNQPVARGSALALTDSSGWVCGAHLHYMVMNPCSALWWCPSVPSSFLDPSVLQQDADGVPLVNQSVVSSNSGLTITSISVPGSTVTGGPVWGGTRVVITGAGFSGVMGPAGVMFGADAAASYTVNSPTQITAYSPPYDPGTVDITVNNNGFSSAASNVDRFTFGCTIMDVPTAAAVTATTVRISAGNASGCVNKLYRYSILPPGGDWYMVQDYSPAASFDWDTSGQLSGSYHLG